MDVPIRFPIKTARLTIRPMRLDDAEELLAGLRRCRDDAASEFEVAGHRRGRTRVGTNQDRPL